MKIGIQELRDNLSLYLAEVERGKTITITRYGKPIAQLVPIRTETIRTPAAPGADPVPDRRNGE
ncbi:type II toxin-antitoxin system prevent-host-death family antitoxin [Kribbella sp. NPDC056861]|uniref:type II toxin-antitoxin system Phd/YefM family antitoxin n=1 Tax=Kribbella sp. NPDC056861 TaxID=3154857 RepID=UPI00342D64D7